MSGGRDTQQDSLRGVGGCGCESLEREMTLGAAAVEGGGGGGCGCKPEEPTLGDAVVEGGGDGGCGCGQVPTLGAAEMEGRRKVYM